MNIYRPKYRLIREKLKTFGSSITSLSSELLWTTEFWKSRLDVLKDQYAWEYIITLYLAEFCVEEERRFIELVFFRSHTIMRTALEMPMDKSTVAVWSENIIKDLVCLAIQFGLMTIQPSNISAEVACCNSLITEQTIDKIKHIISKDGKCSIRNLRSVVEAIKVIKDMQIPWRELPESYGSWKTIYNIYRKWHNAGLLQSILSVINVD